MDPAFPDLVASAAAAPAEELTLKRLSLGRAEEGVGEIPEIFAILLRLLARLW
jgi:hypothetical protein